MSRNWFTVILSNLHVNDDATYIPRNEAGHDPMHKIRSVLHHLLTHFTASFSPYENLTIDKGVCGFQGTVIFHVYIKNLTSIVSRHLPCVTLRQYMFCALKCIMVKVNGPIKSLDCFKDYFLVILIRGIQFS
jgi:hypothetical protein